MGRGSRDTARASAELISEVVLVGVAVIVGLLVAVFVLGIGADIVESGPRASFAYQYDSDAGGTATCGPVPGTALLTVEHNGGEPIPTAQLSVVGETALGRNVSVGSDCQQSGVGSDITAGDTFSVAIVPDGEVQLVWHGPSSSAVLGAWRGQAA